MTTMFQHSRMGWSVTNKEAARMTEQLPVGCYTIVNIPLTGFRLRETEMPTLPPKLYGETHKQCDRILKTFFDRPRATGILLEGQKGSGKTLLAQTIITEAAKQGVITLLVGEAYRGEDFQKLLQDIDQPAIVFIDEFEKVYKSSFRSRDDDDAPEDDPQESLLTLLDGAPLKKKLFVLTVNDSWQVSSFMKNRPGRLFYRLSFMGLSEQFIREYCVDSLKNQQHLDNICELGANIPGFSFDMLKALVEECNRFNEAPKDALPWLNIRLESESITYRVLSYTNKAGTVFPFKTTYRINFLSSSWSIHLSAPKSKGKRVMDGLIFNHHDSEVHWGKIYTEVHDSDGGVLKLQRINDQDEYNGRWSTVFGSSNGFNHDAV